MKKLLSALLAGLMILSLTACGGKRNVNGQDKSGETNPPYKHSDSIPETENPIESDFPEETEVPEETDDTESNSDTPAPPPTGIRPEFKEALDSYEKFFDEYIEFMEKFSNSDNALGMLADYSKFMTKYAETLSAMEALGEGEMSKEETAYYLEVTTRINQKLISVAY